MKKIRLALLLTALSWAAVAQQNLSLVSHLDYNSLANDIWGYTAPDGTEYALVGLRSGVSIVSLADPANPVEVQFIPGGNSVWRDLKTRGQYCYVTTDQPGTKEGLLIIDLSGAPDNITWSNWTPFMPEFSDTLFTCHNIWIDEAGYAYITGCNINNGGVVLLDVFSTPGTPKYVGKGPALYMHDAYARGNRMYTSEMFEGRFGAYDISDHTNPVLLGVHPTPFAFSHNVWLSDDGKTLFNTDEKAKAPTSAFDVTDPENIKALDEFNPPATLGENVIPHNVHVRNDYLVISHYTDGCVVVDASRPTNLVQVGQYDTSTDFEVEKGFHGAWGAYPFFPSGRIAVTDIENGLFILEPSYKRACFLDGTVTNVLTGEPVEGVKIEIQSDDPNISFSDAAGNFSTGQVTSGKFVVTFQAKGYASGSESDVLLENGMVTTVLKQLTPLPDFTVTGRVLDKTTGLPIAGATVFYENKDFSYSAQTIADGNFSIANVTFGTYMVHAGKWGYETATKEAVDAGSSPVFELEPAYRDNFNLDLGWTRSGDAKDGPWERGLPNGTKSGNDIYNPFNDSPNDEGGRCYLTGNQGTAINDDDVDGGVTILASPPMELLSRYNRPVLSYETWFFLAGSSSPPDDTLSVFLTNGKDTVLLEKIAENVQTWRPSPVFDLLKRINLTDAMQVIFRISDYDPRFHFTEGGLDHFRVEESIPDEYFTVQDELVKMRIFPNPFNDKLTVDYKTLNAFDELNLLVYNTLGQVVGEWKLTGSPGSVPLTLDVTPGVYYIVLQPGDRFTDPVRVVKGQ
jgi:choice-of-anchor B domain-containing protein